MKGYSAASFGNCHCIFGLPLQAARHRDALVPGDGSCQGCSALQMVLVNGGTASTAELIAASLRDNHRAQLLGEKTFGKGRTQRVIPLKGGALLLLSNTVYLTPEHQKVDKVGLADSYPAGVTSLKFFL